MENDLKYWLWGSVALAIGGALMLYPIGPLAANIAFICIKVCMVAGLLVMLFAHKRWGFFLWAIASVGAVCMTCIKWSVLGEPSFLLIASMVVDVCMPIGAWLIMRKHPLPGKTDNHAGNGE